MIDKDALAILDEATKNPNKSTTDQGKTINMF
jgi:hypothetical protein